MNLKSIKRLRKDNVELLFDKVLSEYSMEIAVEAQVHLERYLQYYDPQLLLIFEGEKDLFDFYFEFESENYEGICPRRETLNLSLFHICDYVELLAEDGIEMENFDIYFDSFVRRLLGWSPLFIDENGEGGQLPKGDLVANRYSKCSDKEEIINELIIHEGSVLDYISHESLKKEFPKFAEIARRYVLDFMRRNNIDKGKVFLNNTIFQTISDNKNNFIYRASRLICESIKNHEQIDLSKAEKDVVESELAQIFGLPVPVS